MLIPLNPSHQRAMTIIAATLLALASGTNYAYSAWAPQFAHKMHLSSTRSNLIGASANLGMYATGAFTGKLTDSKGPRPSGFMGALCIAVGYFPLQKAYANGPGSMGMFFLCFFSFLTGVGGCIAFQASLKTAATNFPRHRGTATAFPLAAYGLSAFFFSSIAAAAFPDNTARFLMLLAIAPAAIALVSTNFLVTIPSAYRGVNKEERRGTPPTTPTTTPTATAAGHARAHSYTEPGTQVDIISVAVSSRSDAAAMDAMDDSPGEIEASPTAPNAARGRDRDSTVDDTVDVDVDVEARRHDGGSGNATPGADTQVKGEPSVSTREPQPEPAANERSSLMSSRSSTSSHDSSELDLPPTASHHHSLYPDVRGWALLRKTEFWQLVLLLGLLSGIGLMTINNIGNDVKPLWTHWDATATPIFIQKQQVLQVSILSIFSCAGRLLSGIGSDLLVNNLHVSRVWCLFASSLVFCIAQIAATMITNPHHLAVISSTTGLAYGFLFGVFPSIVAHVFGVGGLSQNWGIMCLAPVISGNIFNLLYGSIYDHHSVVEPGGERGCEDGINCYKETYQVAVLAGVAGAVVSLWTIWHEKRTVERLAGGKERERLS